MAAGYLSAIGTEYGPCTDEDCGHTDCAFGRKQLKIPCTRCGKVIEPDIAYFNATPDDAPVWTKLVHALCEYEAIDRERESA